MRHTGCDQHLVHLLVHPLTKARFFLVPGTILVGFLVNMPIVSQSSTAVTIGAVIIPILRAARVPPVTIGAALLFGCSIGGELLNPAAPELRTVVTVSQALAKDAAKNDPNVSFKPEDFDSERCVQRIVPLDLLGLCAGTLAFWWLAYRYESRRAASPQPEAAPEPAHALPADWPRDALGWTLYVGKAVVPLLPLVFLYFCSYPLKWIPLDKDLLDTRNAAGEYERFDARLIGVAMLMGVAAAALMTPSKLHGIAASFFEGAGFGFANIISLIVVAQCFAEGIRQIGIAQLIGNFIHDWPDLLVPLAGLMPLGFGALCGSGMATTQGLFGFLAEPALNLGVDPTHIGAVVAIAAAAGRTISPVAAVTLMCARMTGTKPLELTKQVAVPVLISVAFVIVVAMIIAPTL
jgi:DcuC family C4-dicarboxylate transporter